MDTRNPKRAIQEPDKDLTMLWSLLSNKNALKLGGLILLIIGVIYSVHYVQKLGSLKHELEVQKQINEAIQQRNNIDEKVSNKSDYDICIANGGLHEHCK